MTIKLRYYNLFVALFLSFCSCNSDNNTLPKDTDTLIFDGKNPPQVSTKFGKLEGIEQSGVRIFKGIPYARPPLANLRWKPPQPMSNWEGIKKATAFGPRAMQRPIFDDMNFRSDGVSEDCLYLNVWTPATRIDEQLPVLLYFYGGGLFAGDGSEYRYDGENIARRGVIAITVNYRLNVFGFMAHPELTAESPNGSSGNYGHLDQVAALRWIKENVAAFGGDPKKITIAGESAGSFSVSALMASPLSRGLISGAIGSSGAIMGTRRPAVLTVGEKRGLEFADTLGVASIEALRSLPAETILEATKKFDLVYFTSLIDGYFLPTSPELIFQSAEQADVPLLAGWNANESSYQAILMGREPTPENYRAAVEALYPENPDAVLAAYPGNNVDQVKASASDLAGDRFTGYSTWKWIELHQKTSNQQTWRYFYAQPRPGKDSGGAVHSAEIEYAMGNLPTNSVYDWTPGDYRTSQIFQSYYVNFVKNGNPNGPGVPYWPPVESPEAAPIMVIDSMARLKKEENRKRYLVLEKLIEQRQENEE